MLLSRQSLVERAQRFSPRPESNLKIEFSLAYYGEILDISRTGLGACFAAPLARLPLGTRVEECTLSWRNQRFNCGGGEVVRVTPRSEQPWSHTFVAFRFDEPQDDVLTSLTEAIEPPCQFSDKSPENRSRNFPPVNAYTTTIDRFYGKGGHDLFTKCHRFSGWIDDMMQKKIYQRLYRLTVTGPLDHRISVFDTDLNGERSMVCFDSNSYLGLHLHPKVIEKTVEVTRRMGYGTASAQLLCGSNRYLCELEQALSEFHGREAAIVFPSGFAANTGTVAALLRKQDALLRDQIAHASIQEGCKAARADFNRTFAHNDMTDLEALLCEAEAAKRTGKLIVTDGVFSMHGRVAPLPKLVELSKKYHARLMIDDAHGVGVLGAHGKGIEEHFNLPGSIDVLMGTLSKALGAVGGYVTGSTELINYLRFFAPSGMFTTALPAATCAGLTEALRLITTEPEHRYRLWHNIRRFVPALRDAGFIVSNPESPIITLFVGDQGFMYRVSRELSEAGIKCGNVAYPAIAKGESILRFTLNARHTTEDLDYTVDTLIQLGKRFGMLGKTREELRDLGHGIAIASAA